MKKNLLIFVIILVSLIEIFELSMLFLWSKNSIYKEILVQSREKRTKAIEHSLDHIEDKIDSILAQLTIASYNEKVAAGEAESCSQELEKYLPSFQGKVDVINRTDQNAKVICSSRQLSMGADLNKNLPHLKKIIEDENHPAVMGRIRNSPVNGEPVFGIHVPVYQGKQFVGTLTAAIYLEDIEKKYLRDIVEFPETRIFLRDDNGDYLYKNSENIEQGKDEVLISSTKQVFPDREWTLTAITKEKDLIQSIEKRVDLTADMNISDRIILVIVLTLVTGMVIILISLRFCLKEPKPFR